MAVVLGIDAAWTAGQPSGVALVAGPPGEPRLIAAAACYPDFLAHASGRGAAVRATGALPDVPALLAAARSLATAPVDLVAVDMPLARTPIRGRRAADDAISRAYGARWCSTHTPSVTRPGPIADALRSDFAAAGYPLRMLSIAAPGLIEVYPHPALVELAGAPVRLPYKQANRGRYWPDLPPRERRLRLLSEWQAILGLLDREIAGTAAALLLPDPGAPGHVLKAFEDRLDAVVCAWIGVCALSGRASPYGDDDAAIWVPDRPTDYACLGT